MLLISDADAWIRACWGKKSCLGKPLDLCWVAELVRIEVLSCDSMSCLFILCLQLVSLCTGCAHGNYVDACAIESYQMKILENGTSHNLVWGKPVTLFHTATDSRRHRHSRHSHYAEFLKPDAMGVMMRSRGRCFKGRFLRDGFQYLCRPILTQLDPIGCLLGLPRHIKEDKLMNATYVGCSTNQ